MVKFQFSCQSGYPTDDESRNRSEVLPQDTQLDDGTVPLLGSTESCPTQFGIKSARVSWNALFVS